MRTNFQKNKRPYFFSKFSILFNSIFSCMRFYKDSDKEHYIIFEYILHIHSMRTHVIDYMCTVTFEYLGTIFTTLF